VLICQFSCVMGRIDVWLFVVAGGVGGVTGLLAGLFVVFGWRSGCLVGWLVGCEVWEWLVGGVTEQFGGGRLAGRLCD